MGKREEELKKGREHLQEERQKLEVFKLEMQQQYELLKAKEEAAEELLLRDELKREELFRREVELAEEQAKMEKEKKLEEIEMQYRAMEEEEREEAWKEREESLTRRETIVLKELEKREEMLTSQVKEIKGEEKKVQEKQEELIQRETRFKEEQASFEERKNRGEMGRVMPEEEIRRAWKEREEEVTRREAEGEEKTRSAEEDRIADKAKVTEEEKMKEEIILLDKEYKRLVEQRADLLRSGELVLDRIQTVYNIPADVTPQRALDKLGRTDFANMQLLDHVVQEVRNRSDTLVLHYRLNNNLDRDMARQATEKLGDVMGGIKAEIKLMRDQGLDLTRAEIENLADVVLTDKSKTDVNKVTSNLTSQVAEWARVLEKLEMLNRRYLNSRSLHADFSVHRVQLIMQCLDPSSEEESEDRVLKMFSVREIALDYTRALYNTSAGIALMAKAKNLGGGYKLPIIVETAALEEFKSKKLTNGKKPNFYHWRKKILTIISQFGVEEKDQPKVILSSTDGQAADIIRARIDKGMFKTGGEVITVLRSFFGNKEELVDKLASRHIEIGQVCTETSMQNQNYDLHTLLSLREKRLRSHQEAIEEMDYLLEDEEIQGRSKADLLTPRYMKSLRKIFPKETLKTTTTKRADRMELLDLLRRTIKQEYEEAIDELNDIPPDLKSKSAESTRAFFGLEEKNQDDTEDTEKNREVQEKKNEIRRHVGTVKWFNVRRRHGFITRNDTGEDVFVHQSHIKANNPNKKIKSIGDGEEVEFSLATDLGRTWATDVSGPKGAPVKGSQHAA